MHAEAFTFVARAARDITARRLKVVEIGSRNLNGTVRPLFEGHDYIGIDAVPGEGVDVVADGATWGETAAYDLGVCCEVFEHSADWLEIVANLRRIVRPGGMLILTCATDPRQPHSGIDGRQFDPVPGWVWYESEWYANVLLTDLCEALEGCRYINIEAERGDLRAIVTVG